MTARPGLDVLIVGAGIAGLTAAARLRAAGRAVCVVDKGRGAGGRASTRRQHGLRFDHGAQYFTVRTPAFQREVAGWARRGWVAEWRSPIVAVDPDGVRPLSDPVRRYVGTPGMNAIAAALARDVDTRFGVRVTGVERRHHWQISLDNGDRLTSSCLLLTLPPPQCSALLSTQGTPLLATVERVAMRPVWAVMAQLERTPDVGFDAAFVNTGPLSWVAHDSSKPGRQTRNCWVLHASQSWTEEHLDAQPARVADRLIESLGELVGAPLAARECIAHRWLYAQAAEALDVTLLADESQALIVAGDWCAGSRVEGAWRSGRAAADLLATA